MKQSSKSSTSMGGDGNCGAGDFDEELQGRHVNIFNNCNIHHHHYQNEANGAEEQTPLKQVDPVKATPSNTDEEQKPIEKNLPTQALPINDSPEEKPYVRIQSEADTNYFLAVRDGKVIVALFDLDDESQMLINTVVSQHWYENYSRITDKSKRHCFSLVNKSTGQAIKYSDENDSPKQVQLIAYNPRVLYRSILWTSSSRYYGVPLHKDYMLRSPLDYVRLSPLDYPLYTLDANFSSIGVSHDGDLVNINKKTDSCTTNSWEIIDCREPVLLADPVKATPIADEEQKPIEKTSPINDSPEEKPYIRLQSGADPNYFLSVRDGKVIVASFNLDDESQHWYENYSKIMDKSGLRGFSLVNKSTGQAIKYSGQGDSRVQLITYNPRVLHRSTLWTLSSSYRQPSCMRLSPLDYPLYTLDANFCSKSALGDGDLVSISKTGSNKSSLWEIVDYLEPVLLP